MNICSNVHYEINTPRNFEMDLEYINKIMNII